MIEEIDGRELAEADRIYAEHVRQGEDAERRIALHTVRELINLIGDDPTREGLLDTPARVVRSWGELFCGYKQNAAELLNTSFTESNYDEMVVVRDIDFHSTCEHHLLPFVGVAHVAYLPNGRYVGLSKIPRVVEVFARRLQLQERLTEQVTTTIMGSELAPKGAACVIKAKHLCLACRGVKKQNAVMVTSSLCGAFRNDPATRAEFMRLIGRG